MKKVIFLILIFFTAPSAMAVDEARCNCFDNGYDTYTNEGDGMGEIFCDLPGGGDEGSQSMKEQCDLNNMAIEWESGCKTAANGGQRTCNFY